MSHRYSLRFESGERSGETIPITGSVFSIGRRPGNSLQVIENSVSGKHAELHVDDRGIFLKDLGSTNGTRIGEARVLESRLEPGAQVTFGNVVMSFLDSQAAAATARAVDGTGVAQEEPAELRVSAENLARAKRGSKLGLVALLVLVAVGGAVGAFFWKGRGGPSGERVRPVVPVEGNLLADGYSFEGDSSKWESRDTLLGSFRKTSRARYSGEEGVSASLEAGESAVHQSPLIKTSEGKRLTARAELRSPGSVLGRIGIQFSTAAEGEGAPSPATAWSTASVDMAAFEELVVETTVPGGYDRARVLLLASAGEDDGGGRVDVDDVSLVSAGGGGPTTTVLEYKFYALGDPAHEASLFKADRVLISNLRFKDAQGLGRGLRPMTVTEEANGLRIAPAGSGPCSLSFVAEPGAGALAGMGAAGYSTISADVDTPQATDVLLGSGVDLVRLSFGGEVALQGRGQGRAYRFQATLPAGGSVLLQLSFREERSAAINLAADAEAAERADDLGLCIAKWTELLDRYPFEQAQVARGEETRARLIRRGIDEIRAVEAEVERARFFRLVDLYKECRAGAVAVAELYRGSDVEEDANALVAGIDAEIEALEADLDRTEVGRLRAILAVLEAQQSTELAAEVRAYLSEHYGEGQ